MFEKQFTDSPACSRRQGGLALFLIHLFPSLSPFFSLSSPHLFFSLVIHCPQFSSTQVFYPTLPLTLSLLPPFMLLSPPLLPCTTSTHHLAPLVPQSHRSRRDKIQSNWECDVCTFPHPWPRIETHSQTSSFQAIIVRVCDLDDTPMEEMGWSVPEMRMHIETG